MDKILFFIILICSVILQICIFDHVRLLGIHYELLFSLTVFIGIKYDWKKGYLCGLWCGLLNDVFSIGPFGFSVLTYGFTGLSVSSFQTVIFTQQLGTRLFILFIMSILISFFSFMILDLFYYSEKQVLFKLDLLSVAIVNTVFSIPLYRFLDNISYEKRRYH
ncbi:MAG: rod shape-determining protein MreD [Candidatus Aureabacteria bacterium]|nr:rod shape-determining protein MreD [Candidatus Auribacterota bacterium]